MTVDELKLRIAGGAPPGEVVEGVKMILADIAQQLRDMADSTEAASPSSIDQVAGAATLCAVAMRCAHATNVELGEVFDALVWVAGVVEGPAGPASQ